MEPRKLTHDERRAAEAAFRGLPVDEKWSQSAKSLYERLTRVIPTVSAPLLHDLSNQDGDPVRDRAGSHDQEAGAAQHVEAGHASERHTSTLEKTGSAGFPTRAEAIQAGVLVDVTDQATELGLTLPVGMSKSLWEFGITGSDTIPEDLHQGRLRDLLMALRIHLSLHSVVLPISQFPAVLSFPPQTTPQICAISAVVQAHLSNEPVMTLFLPSELDSNLPLPLN